MLSRFEFQFSPLSSYVTLDKLIDLSVPCLNEGNNIAYPVGL